MKKIVSESLNEYMSSTEADDMIDLYQKGYSDKKESTSNNFTMIADNMKRKGGHFIHLSPRWEIEKFSKLLNILKRSEMKFNLHIDNEDSYLPDFGIPKSGAYKKTDSSYKSGVFVYLDTIDDLKNLYSILEETDDEFRELTDEELRFIARSFGKNV